MRAAWLILFVFTVQASFGQNITGIWRGHFRSSQNFQSFSNVDDRYRFEVQIAQDKNKFEAVTYSYKSSLFYGKALANGRVDPATSRVQLKELKIVEVRMIPTDYACTMTCYLKYFKLGEDEYLEGTYVSYNTKDSGNCGSGTVFLHKVEYSDFHKEPFLEKKEDEMAASNSHAPKVPAPDYRIDSVQKKEVSKNAAKKPASPTTKTSPVPKNSYDLKPSPATTKIKPLTGHKDSASLVHAPANPKGQGSSSKPNPGASKASAKALAPAAASASALKPQEQIPTGKIELSAGKDSMKTDYNLLASALPLPKDLANRTNELIKTFTVNTRDVQLYIYDDGTIDNDTVSVYFDKQLVVHNARLTDQAIVVKLHLDETSDTHEVVLVAENLGDIPPNTSLMVVKAGEKRFEVRIVSTEQKNAVVLFRFQKAG